MKSKEENFFQRIQTIRIQSTPLNAILQKNISPSKTEKNSSEKRAADGFLPLHTLTTAHCDILSIVSVGGNTFLNFNDDSRCILCYFWA